MSPESAGPTGAMRNEGRNQFSSLHAQYPDKGIARSILVGSQSCPRFTSIGLPSMRMVFETFLLIVLPYGTALICGALTDRFGRIVSGWSSIAGLALGVYFFSKTMELLSVG